MTEALKIVIVEDDVNSREILASIILRKFKDLSVYTACNGREGWEVFTEQMPDVLLTDINMPEMGGLQLAEKVRELKPEAKIIVITADTGRLKAEESIGKGFKIDHYILKPVDYQKLFEAIEQSLLALRQAVQSEAPASPR